MVLAAGQISLRMYPQPGSPSETVAEMMRQARRAEAAGFDGLMTSEHHGGFPGYVPNPLQLAGWLLEGTERVWAAACPLLLPLYHWSHVAEQAAWLAARFPGRVGLGVASGGLAQDFEMADLAYEERLARFRADLPRVVGALRGETESPLADDPAIRACAETPIPVVSAAQSPAAVRRAAREGVGVLYDSLQTIERMREISDLYEESGGTGPRIAIRRVWVGPRPEAQVEAQMDFYRGYAAPAAQAHWGDGQQLVGGETGAEVAEKLLLISEQGGCDGFNLRVHLKGIERAQVEEQIDRLGAEMLDPLRNALAQRAER